MIQYSYNLFPKLFIAIGYFLIILAIALLIFSLTSMKSQNLSGSFAISFAMIFIRLIMISFRSNLVIDKKSGFVLKESGLLGMKLSGEKVKILHSCTGILINEKGRTGTGYYRCLSHVY